METHHVSMQRGLKGSPYFSPILENNIVSMQRGLKVIASSGSAALNSLPVSMQRGLKGSDGLVTEAMAEGSLNAKRIESYVYVPLVSGYLCYVSMQRGLKGAIMPAMTIKKIRCLNAKRIES